MNNAIYSVYCYKYKGQWVFDDEARDIKREALVCGADVAITLLTHDVAYAEHGFLLQFSSWYFPENRMQAEYSRRDKKCGYWYRNNMHGFDIWLCPVLDVYFDRPPGFLFAAAKPIVYPWYKRAWYAVVDMVTI